MIKTLGLAGLCLAGLAGTANAQVGELSGFANEIRAYTMKNPSQVSTIRETVNGISRTYDEHILNANGYRVSVSPNGTVWETELNGRKVYMCDWNSDNELDRAVVVEKDQYSDLARVDCTKNTDFSTEINTLNLMRGTSRLLGEGFSENPHTQRQVFDLGNNQVFDAAQGKLTAMGEELKGSIRGAFYDTIGHIYSIIRAGSKKRN
jgi:hypothetical protein